VVGGPHIRFEEEGTRISEGPVVRNSVFWGFLKDFNDSFEVLMFFDEFVSCAGAYAFDRIEVVATEKDAKINKLGLSLESKRQFHW